jgi:hypothetical protein
MRTKEREEALEVLRGMTKDEIISWLSNEVGFLFRPPRKSHLLFGRYEAACNAALKRRERNKLPDGFAKKLDAGRARLAQAKDHKEFLAIAKEIEPQEKFFKKWLEECKAIGEADKRVESLYEAYRVQSDLESRKAGVARADQGEG